MRKQRRPKSETQWKAIVEQYSAGHVSEEEFCRDRDLNIRTFRNWRYRITGTTRLLDDDEKGPTAFSPINLRQTQNVKRIHIELPGGVRISCSELPLDQIVKLAQGVSHER